MVAGQVEAAELGIRQRRPLSFRQVGRELRGQRFDQGPPILLDSYSALASADRGQLVEQIGDFSRNEQSVTSRQSGQLPASLLELCDLSSES
jgi:hypothetical protein